MFEENESKPLHPRRALAVVALTVAVFALLLLTR